MTAADALGAQGLVFLVLGVGAVYAILWRDSIDLGRSRAWAALVVLSFAAAAASFVAAAWTAVWVTGR